MDGNCMFRSICDQLYQDASRHMEVREKIMDYIEEEEAHFSLFIEDDESFEDYVSRMRWESIILILFAISAAHLSFYRTQSEWGGHQELYAASQVLNINIHVHQMGAARFLLPAPPPSTRQTQHLEPPRPPPTDAHLSYHGEYHYNSLKPAEGPVGAPSSSVHAQGKREGSVPVAASAHHSAVCDHVALSVPWASETDIHTAMRLCDFDFSATVEMLIANPGGEYGGADGSSCLSEAFPSARDDDPTGEEEAATEATSRKKANKEKQRAATSKSGLSKKVISL
jgi:hypothetical protein